LKNLKDKLALLKKTSKKPGNVNIEATTSSLPDQTDVRLCTVLEGRLEPTGQGDILLIRRCYPLGQKYGRTTLSDSLSMPVRLLAKIYQGLEHFDMENTLFFDTETTGLAGGSGTYAFLVGIGFYESGEFVTEQLLMRDHSDEPALLAHFSRRLQNKTSLVSFNGRTFDSQLLATRYGMHRLSEPFGQRSHLDLLHLSRRLWGLSALPDCRLETLENCVLGAPRHQDVPGWMIPSLFFDFLRDRNPVPLKGVVEHNRRDLLAMVALCSHLNNLLRDEPSTEDPHVHLGLARLWAALGLVERSDNLFRRALKDGRLSKVARQKGLIYWAREFKQRRLLDQSALLWRRALTHDPGNLEATVELAKWLEHGRKDYRSALLLVEGGLRVRTITSVRRRELEHRAKRLRDRLDRRARRQAEGFLLEEC
jgi:uncharacterized protein